MELKKLGSLIPEAILAELETCLPNFPEVDSVEKMSHFLGQTMHESGNFKHLTENLNYSAQGLLSTFPHHFKDVCNQVSRHRQEVQHALADHKHQ